MFNMQTLQVQASKRKQECTHFGAMNEAPGIEAFNSKKQRLSYGQYAMNGEQTKYEGNNMIANGFAQMNGHSQATNGHMQTDSGHLQVGNVTTNGEMTNGDNRVSEAMECAEEQSVEVNGNLPSSNGKYCPHGHLNMCTTYNVPCRYPRMYCHPGGMLEDRLSIYHGF